jgi:hypothetical protein
VRNDCVLCASTLLNVRKVSKHDEADEFEVECSTCGKFQVTVDAWELYSKSNHGTADRRFLLSALAKTAPLRGAPPPRFTQQSFRDAQEGRIREPSLVEKRESLLRWIEHLSRLGSRSPYGAKVNVDPSKSYPAAWCRDMRGGDWTEWNFTMHRLTDGGLVDADGTSSWITNAGWEYLESRPKAGGSQGFVAMAFREDLADVYTALAAGIEAAGYKPLRIDNHEYNGGVMDEILAQIRQSRFLVADLTYNRGGVYREEGFALGRDLPAIHTCRADHVDGPDELRVHFDVRHLNLITWTADKLPELTKRLKNRIEATLGRGPI